MFSRNPTFGLILAVLAAPGLALAGVWFSPCTDPLLASHVLSRDCHAGRGPQKAGRSSRQDTPAPAYVRTSEG